MRYEIRIDDDEDDASRREVKRHPIILAAYGVIAVGPGPKAAYSWNDCTPLGYVVPVMERKQSEPHPLEPNTAGWFTSTRV